MLLHVAVAQMKRGPTAAHVGFYDHRLAIGFPKLLQVAKAFLQILVSVLAEQDMWNGWNTCFMQSSKCCRLIVAYQGTPLQDQSVIIHVLAHTQSRGS